MKVYLSENQFGQVKLGDPVVVTVDSRPGETFAGVVTYISPRAEFTPTTVQTKEDRARLVYAVEISLDNPDLALKPGMIADATFGE